MELLFVVFLIGFAAGYAWASFKFVKALKDAAEEAGINLEKELTKSQPPKNAVYKLVVEQHGDMLYLFDKEKDSFICQGSSVQELAKLAKQYKNIMYAAVLYGDKVFQFKDGESTEVV